MAASIPQLLHVPSLDSTIGAVLVGTVVGVMLYGLTVHQTYRYFKLYPADRLLLKVLVATILVFETVHTVLWIIVVYHYTISEAFNLPGVLLGHWAVRTTFMITSFAVLVCQIFYVCRVYLIGFQYRWLAVPAVISMLSGFSFGMAGGVEAFLYAHYITDFQHFSWMVSIAYGFAVLTDVILTSALVFVLHRSRTGFKRTDSMIDVLIIYTINTGLLTSVVSILAFVFALILPGNLIYAAITIVGSKLYANSVLAVLNSRRSIDDRFLDAFESFDLPSIPNSRDITCEVYRRGAHSPMVWNAPQMASCVSQTTTISQGMSFATHVDGDVGSRV
ncbi:hypothetical protein BD413DRAFT_611970 [Trametes elegans]|nr:hypothetical protein BD413DRAFT_611970 [Trametes elegans]